MILLFIWFPGAGLVPEKSFFFFTYNSETITISTFSTLINFQNLSPMFLPWNLDTLYIALTLIQQSARFF